jgi:hypothetical protein
VFTEYRHRQPINEIYGYRTASPTDFAAFAATPTGTYFNANVRNNASWTAIRVS